MNYQQILAKCKGEVKAISDAGRVGKVAAAPLSVSKGEGGAESAMLVL